MGEKYVPVKGDRVRVVYEGVVTSSEYDGSRDDGFAIEREVPVFANDPALVSVERIEPPVEVFKPGDVVRDKTTPGWVYSVGSKGYFDHTADQWFTASTFTSEHYERVILS